MENTENKGIMEDMDAEGHNSNVGRAREVSEVTASDERKVRKPLSGFYFNLYSVVLRHRKKLYFVMFSTLKARNSHIQMHESCCTTSKHEPDQVYRHPGQSK
ncbi:hypothetical protein GOODEAATRI_000312 [Goodea atripinnis]|uniref:Uncharacterized protein n=1 Tax=Goodea atripinnis TaxID=208336 RepID=A0ABV0NIR9_9TELE